MYKYLANCLASADTVFIVKYLVVFPPPSLFCWANLCGNYQHSEGSKSFDPKIFIKISIVCWEIFHFFSSIFGCECVPCPFCWVCGLSQVQCVFSVSCVNLGIYGYLKIHPHTRMARRVGSVDSVCGRI